MSQSPGRPPGAMNLRGALDLSTLGKSSAVSAGPAGDSASPYVIAVTEQNFATEVMERSSSVPVVIDFWADWCGPCKQLSPIITKLADEFAGKILVATIDVDANPQVSGAFGVQSIPSVFAVLGGRPLPLFQGAQPEAQIRGIFEQLCEAAAANGVTGRYEPAGLDSDEAEAEEELPATHAAAYAAIEAGDLDAAVAAYNQALAENPQDEEARLGLAQVTLMKRTADVDLNEVRAAAAADPGNVEAVLAVADVDVLGGHVEDAFLRIIDAIRLHTDKERDLLRERLLELFEVVGATDPRVLKARTSLANALF